jgi:hypothetical protein
MASSNQSAPVAPSAQGGASAAPRDEASDARTDLSAADKAVLMAKETGVASPYGTLAPEAERAAAGRQAAKPAAVAPQATGPSAPAPHAAEPRAVGQHPADPKVWLQQINALRAAGKADQADAEMRRFKAAFPHYAAPPAATQAPDLPK